MAFDGSVLTAARRRRLYEVALAAVPLLVFYGVASEQEVALWIAVLASVLGTSVARGHVHDDS